MIYAWVPCANRPSGSTLPPPWVVAAHSSDYLSPSPESYGNRLCSRYVQLLCILPIETPLMDSGRFVRYRRGVQHPTRLGSGRPAFQTAPGAHHGHRVRRQQHQRLFATYHPVVPRSQDWLRLGRACSRPSTARLLPRCHGRFTHERSPQAADNIYRVQSSRLQRIQRPALSCAGYWKLRGYPRSLRSELLHW